MTFLLNSQKRRHLFRLSQSAVPCWGIWCEGFVWWSGTIGSGQSESSGDRQSRPLHPAYSCHTRIQGEEKNNWNPIFKDMNFFLARNYNLFKKKSMFWMVCCIFIHVHSFSSEGDYHSLKLATITQTSEFSLIVL